MGTLLGSSQVEVAVEASAGVSPSVFVPVPLPPLLIKVNARHPGAENHFRNAHGGGPRGVDDANFWKEIKHPADGTGNADMGEIT